MAKEWKVRVKKKSRIYIDLIGSRKSISVYIVGYCIKL
jgi:hypothetical protein